MSLIILIFTGLFINMIHRLNEQVLEGPDSATLPRRNQDKLPAIGASIRSNELSEATSTLKSMVEENEKGPTKLPADSSNTANVSETTNNGEDGDDDDSEADVVEADNRPAKRPKVI